MGVVSENGVNLGDSQKFNGNVAFTGSGEAVVDIAQGTLVVQKSLYGSADITLVKRGAGTLQANDGYAPLNDTKTAYSEARDKADGYYGNRKFVFGGVKLQGGTLDLRQYYWVRDCDFQFDANGVVLAVNRLRENLGVHSLELGNCRLRETANVTDSTHRITGADADCFLHFFGDRIEDTTFSGQLAGQAGLVWEPGGAATFTFRRAVSPTTGILTVSNGMIRVMDGASFPSLSALTVSGANARFRVDRTADASFPAADMVVENGGRLYLETGMTVKSFTMNGTTFGDGLYCGAAGLVKNTGCTVVDGIDGPGHVRVGALPAEAAAAAVTWNGTGDATEPANWNGAAELPALADGSAAVTVAGGTAFTADTDVWVKGFTLETGPFAFAAAPGKTLSIGSGGIVNTANGALTVGSADGTVVAAGDQTWDMGTGPLTVNGDIATLAGTEHWIRSAGNPVLNLNAATPDWTAPLFITNMNVKFNVSGALGPACSAPAFLYGSSFPSFADDITVDRSLWLAKGGTITVSAGKNLTFNGFVCATNGQALSVTAGEGSTIVFNRLFMSRNGCLLDGSGTIVFNDSFHARDRPKMRGTVTVELHKDGNRLNGNMDAFSGGRLKAMAPYVITKQNTRRQTADGGGGAADGYQNTMINAKDAFILDLNGFDQSIDQLAAHADGNRSGGHVTSATPATLHLQTEKSYWANHNYSYGFGSGFRVYSTADGYGFETSDKGYWEGAVTLSYEAKDDMRRTLMRTSSSTGRIEVVSGTLVFARRAKTAGETFDLKGGTANPYGRLADEDGAWPYASAVSVTGGTLVFEHGACIGNGTDVYLSTAGGALRLEEGVSQKCHDLYIDGVRQKTGRTYGGESSSAAVKNACFAGPGVLYVRGDNVGLVIVIR